MADKKIVGSQEWCALPDLSIPALNARVDSGAETSSLHAFNIQTFLKNETLWVSFEIRPIKTRSIVIRCELPVSGKKLVKSSNGLLENRFVVQTNVALAAMTWPIFLTLTNRDAMGFRMLLGREAMEGRLLVDPQHVHLYGMRSDADLTSMYAEAASLSRLKIGILSNSESNEFAQRVAERGEINGHEISILKVANSQLYLTQDDAKIFSDGKLISDYHAVIPLHSGTQLQLFLAILQQLEWKGVYTINASHGLRTLTSYHAYLSILHRYRLPVPPTTMLGKQYATDHLLRIQANNNHIFNFGQTLAHTGQGASGNLIPELLKSEIVVQEIPEAAEIIQALVAGRTIVTSRRLRNQQFEKIELKSSEKKLMLKVANVFHLRFCEIFFTHLDGRAVVLGINTDLDFNKLPEEIIKQSANRLLSNIERHFGVRTN